MTQPDPPPTGAISDPAAAAAVAALQTQVQQLAARFVALAGFAAGRAEESDPAAAPPEAAGSPPEEPGEAVPGEAQPEESEPEEPTAERAWWWPSLSGEDTVQAAERLGMWVEHALLARHPHYGKTLLPCWWRHPGVVDELSALRAVWHGAYAAPDRDPTAAAEYLARWLPATMTRIEATFARTKCTVAGGKDLHLDTDEKYHRPQWTQPEALEVLTAPAGAAAVSPAQM